MSKSRTRRFIDYLQDNSYGTVTAWPEGKRIRAVFRKGDRLNIFRIQKNVIEQGKLTPEYLGAEVLKKLMAMPKKE